MIDARNCYQKQPYASALPRADISAKSASVTTGSRYAGLLTKFDWVIQEELARTALSLEQKKMVAVCCDYITTLLRLSCTKLESGAVISSFFFRIQKVKNGVFRLLLTTQAGQILKQMFCN